MDLKKCFSFSPLYYYFLLNGVVRSVVFFFFLKMITSALNFNDSHEISLLSTILKIFLLSQWKYRVQKHHLVAKRKKCFNTSQLESQITFFLLFMKYLSSLI